MYPAFQQALGRWTRIWDLQVSNLPVEEWKKLGFMRDAGPEFCQLAYIFLEAEARGLFKTEKLRSMDTENMGYVNYLLEAFSQTDLKGTRDGDDAVCRGNEISTAGRRSTLVFLSSPASYDKVRERRESS